MTMTTRQVFILAPLLCLVSALCARADEGAPQVQPPQVHVLVWDERQPSQKEAYPNFLGNAIAEYLAKQPGFVVKSVGLDDPEQGLAKSNVDEADVLIWWAHIRQGEIKPETARAIVDRVVEGKLALVPLHSALSSRPFIEAMRERSLFEAVHRSSTVNGIPRPTNVGPSAGRIQIDIRDPGPDAVRMIGMLVTPVYEVGLGGDGTVRINLTWPACSIAAWREDGKPSHVSVLRPDHPIAAGLPTSFDIPHTEMYDEPFQVPEPDVVVFEEKWDSGEQFRSGCLWSVGRGKVFYFRPGHETYAVYKQAETLKVLENAARWLAAEQANNR
jgi:trehalose utilization protein